MTTKNTGRREDRRLITGGGRYSADWSMPGQLYAAFRRADHAHAAIRRIDKRAAEAAPGVAAVFVGRDVAEAGFRTVPPMMPFPGRGGAKILVPERAVLARDRVRFVGEEIAMVVAKTAAEAADAAELIDVDYEDLPVVIGFDNALAADTPAIHANIPGNVCFDVEYGDEAKATAAFARAAQIVRADIDSPRVAPTPMEPRAVVAWYDPERQTYEIRCGNQGGLAMRDALAVMLGVPPAAVRVHMVDVGGAFGARTQPFPENALLLFAAKKLGKPVKWVSTRSEDFLTDFHGRAIRVSGELALDKDGKFLAFKTEWLCDSGAYLSSAGAMTNTSNGISMSSGVYEVEAFYARHRQVMTNTAPTSAFRGAGRPEAALIIERLVDEGAAALGIDPIELRRRNVIPKAKFPYKTHTGIVFDSGDFAALLDRAERESNWREFPARQAAAAKRGKLRGIGCAAFIEPSGGGGAPKDQVAVQFDVQGIARLYLTATASGQGYETVFPDIVAAVTGLDPARMEVRASDPDGPAIIGGAAIGSRTGMTSGSGFKLAADEIVKKGLALAAEALEASPLDVEFRDGRYTVKGTDKTIALHDVVLRHAGGATHPLDTIAEVPAGRAFPSGAHVAEVEIDAATGAAEIVAYTAVDDVGNVINHQLAEGQLHGGIVHSAGHVFGEDCHYDRESGQMLAGSFTDYIMPRADLVRGLRAFDCGVPSPNNLLGAKGAGESGAVGGLSTCMNAVVDALRRVDVREFDLPATPGRLWAALQRRKAR
ncbi:MAG TPA: xanthine dehydrogenase family protein molybdopterin-binding subunit [Stellaceae bacterium]|nr:xanthine dehydrogenase family protein molybdopterin-binding subunit [Stellaceae bacterium]